MNDVISSLEGRLVVSCQALSDEPLFSSFIMGRMALAAKMGGAGGIRANTVVDIEEIKRNVDLPVIGIIKRVYPDSDVYITPTMKEVRELMSVRPEIIALDATNRPRPGSTTLDGLYHEIRKEYPDQLLMADCSTYEEAMHADSLGFDFIGTTMVGYTAESRDMRIDADDFAILRRILRDAGHRVICEGNIDTPAKARRVIELGAFCVVVGGAITRPQNITRRFVEEIER
ncbi:MAG: N-acetylmannosamine-6-phosphate 2-epimerase [Spirochaetales bacterium]|nr:N-acetylmannosamine-6-phosphate 2-epimerase [Spirochaetales bacterium]